MALKRVGGWGWGVPFRFSIESSGMTSERNGFRFQRRGLELVEHIIRLWKAVLESGVSFHPDIESSIKVCHKTSLNWNFSWRNDKGRYIG